MAFKFFNLSSENVNILGHVGVYLHQKRAFTICYLCTCIPSNHLLLHYDSNASNSLCNKLPDLFSFMAARFPSLWTPEKSSGCAFLRKNTATALRLSCVHVTSHVSFPPSPTNCSVGSLDLKPSTIVSPSWCCCVRPHFLTLLSTSV